MHFHFGTKIFFKKIWLQFLKQCFQFQKSHQISIENALILHKLAVVFNITPWIPFPRLTQSLSFQTKENCLFNLKTQPMCYLCPRIKSDEHSSCSKFVSMQGSARRAWQQIWWELPWGHCNNFSVEYGYQAHLQWNVVRIWKKAKWNLGIHFVLRGCLCSPLCHLFRLQASK